MLQCAYLVDAAKDTTKKGYSYILNHYLIPEFGSMPLADISTDGIQQLFNKWSGLAKSTISKMELMLKQILESAVKDKLIKDSPVDKGRLKNPSVIVYERDAIPEAHYFDILDNLHSLTLSDRRLIALLALTGMRRGEALGLRWEDIDTDEKLIHIRRSVVYPDNAPIITTPKSRRESVPCHWTSA